MKATKYLFFLLFLLFGVLAFAADWNCKINLPPNPQNYPKELLLRMMYVDITNSEHQAVTVYLHGEVRRNGKLIGKGNSNKIEIPPGGKRITRSDITRIEKEWWDKEFEKLLLRLPTLPAGDYEACIFVYKAKGKKLLTKCCSVFKSQYVIPPKLISPENGDIVKDDFPIFRWTPVYPRDRATYKLKIVEVYPGQYKFDAMERNEAWFEKDGIVGTSLKYPISAKSFEKNKKYAWQVVATVGVHTRKSEVWEFWYKERPGAGEVVIKRPSEGDTLGSVECIEVDVGGRKDIREITFMLSWDGKKWEKIGTDKNPKDGWIIDVDTYALIFSGTKEAYFKIVAVTKQGKKIETRPLKVTISN